MTHHDWTIALLAATCLHAGFQLTVTVLVYPALARVPVEAWRVEHDRHSRRITPLVAVVYAGVLVTAVGALLTSASYTAGPGVALAVAGNALTLGLTAAVAAPLHGRLGRGRDPRLVRRLLVADRGRSAGVVIGLAGAVAAVL